MVEKDGGWEQGRSGHVEGSGLEKAERTLWLGESQWSSGSAEEASGVEGGARGGSTWSQKNSGGVGKRKKV